MVSVDHEVYLKPAGGNKASTYLKLWIEGSGLAFMNEPFAPFVLTANLFSIKSYDLTKLAEVLPKQSKPPLFVTAKDKTPICAINTVDDVAKTVTLALDKSVESFDPDAFPDAHFCQK